MLIALRRPTRLGLAAASTLCVGTALYLLPRPRRPARWASTLHVASGSEGSLTAARAALLNAAVYLAWQVPAARPTMEAWFVSHSATREPGPSLTPRNALRALLCSFSHSHLLHLGFNMVALLSFSPRLMEGAESAASPKLSPAEYWALYGASGAASSLASSAFSARWGTGAGGLGASGFAFAVLTYYTLCFPDARVLLMFVFNLSAAQALGLASAVNVGLVAKGFLYRRGLCACAGCGLRPTPPPTHPHTI